MRARPESERSTHALRGLLAQLGYQELVNFSFVPEDWERDFAGNAEPIRVLNPIASHLAVMHSSLIGGLVDILKYNLNRRSSRVRLFEIGRVYARDAGLVDGPLAVGGIAQPIRVAGLIYGAASDEQWGEARREADFFDLKGDVERLLDGRTVRFAAGSHPALHPGRSAQVLADGQPVGWIGELHPRWQQKYELPRPALAFELDLAAATVRPVPQAQPVARFPAVQRDLALWFDDATTWQQVQDVVAERRATDPRLAVLRDATLFDLYRPASSSKTVADAPNALSGKDKSLALRLLLQHTDRTLEDADADAAVQAVVDGLAQRLGARLRQ